MEEQKGIIFSSLDEVLKNSMIPYAESVILDRALPRVEDGLKPVQRRILYAMYEMGLTPDKPYKKCAKIVGDCLGKYHPHGDTSVYGALVHMAQDFNMRHVLIDGHGNFGTVDGDGAAAYRYTEARLKPIALELLRDIDKDTVNFSLNFDDSLKEPDTLPGKYPNLLVNGTSGIAVGLATNIPPHNLIEVINGAIAFIDHPRITVEKMTEYIKGPDFPTGGYILAGPELTEAYRTGRGKIKIRARVTVEKEGDKQSLIISEIPYQVNKATLLKKIADLKDDKKDILGGIKDVVDESDRNGMRAVIKLAKDVDAKKILAYLYKNTDLETSFGINMVAIANGKPCQLGLLDIIGYYVNYQRDVVFRRSKFDLERAKERAHILEGLIVAVKNIDAVIKIIRGAENTADAKQKLRDRFSLSEVQAQAILDLRLSKLTKLEIQKLEDELKELKERIKDLTEIIGSKARQWEIVKTELNELKKKYGNERHSSILSDDGTPTDKGGKKTKSKKNDKDDAEDYPNLNIEEELKQVDDLIIGISGTGYIKKMTQKHFNSIDKKVKESASEGDFVPIITKAKSNQFLYVFTNLGNCCKINLEEVSECRYRERGVKLIDIAPEALKSEMPVGMVARDKDSTPTGDVLLFTKDGLIKKTPISEYAIARSYFQALKLKEGDKLIAVEEDKPDTTIAFVTERGIILNCEKTDVPTQMRMSGGVKGLNLSDGDKIVFVTQVDEEGEIVIITDSGYYKRVLSCEVEPICRSRKGVKVTTLGKMDKIIFASYVKEPYNIGVIDNFGVGFMVNTEDLSIESRISKGKTLKDENKKRSPEKAFRIYEKE